MKLNLSLKKLPSLKMKSIIGNISIVLWLFVIVMVVLVAWIVLKEVGKVTSLKLDTTASQNQVVRVDQEKYNQLETKIEENARFIPQPIPKPEAFSTPIEPTTE